MNYYEALDGTTCKLPEDGVRTTKHAAAILMSILN
jgi:hypothetical protein